LFGTYIVFPPDGEKIMEGMRTVFNEFGRLTAVVTDHEVEIAKDKLKASVLMQLDGTTAVCEDIGRQLLTHGRRLSPAEVWLRIDAITPEDIKRVARERFDDAEPAVAAIGSTMMMPGMLILSIFLRSQIIIGYVDGPTRIESSKFCILYFLKM
jgi:processing peptidase subunit beta